MTDKEWDLEVEATEKAAQLWRLPEFEKREIDVAFCISIANAMIEFGRRCQSEAYERAAKVIDPAKTHWELHDEILALKSEAKA